MQEVYLQDMELIFKMVSYTQEKQEWKDRETLHGGMKMNYFLLDLIRNHIREYLLQINQTFQDFRELEK